MPSLSRNLSGSRPRLPTHHVIPSVSRNHSPTPAAQPLHRPRCAHSHAGVGGEGACHAPRPATADDPLRGLREPRDPAAMGPCHAPFPRGAASRVRAWGGRRHGPARHVRGHTPDGSPNNKAMVDPRTLRSGTPFVVGAHGMRPRGRPDRRRWHDPRSRAGQRRGDWHTDIGTEAGLEDSKRTPPRARHGQLGWRGEPSDGGSCVSSDKVRTAGGRFILRR